LNQIFVLKSNTLFINKFYTLLLFLISSTTLFAQQQDSIAIRYSKIISAKTLSKHLHVLASDKYEGRETGKKGQKMAAKYIAEQFKDAGIPPYKNNTYYQEYMLNKIVPKPVVLSVDGKKFQANKDYYNYPGEAIQLIEANNVLFLGYGILDEKYNDYANADVKDKVVMILSGEPKTKDSISLITGTEEVSGWSGYYRTKSRKAKELGAKALLMVVDDIKKEVSENKHRIEAVRLELETKKIEMPTIFISAQLANYILRNDLSISTIEELISNTQKPLKIDTKTSISIEIKDNINKVTSENVLGFIEGSDLKDQLIVVTAHYDHLGMESKKVIYNGADDDGSGTVAIINMAAAFEKAKKEGHSTRRSVLFMTVSGEEKGLLGSSYYVEHPEFPLENTVCDLNIDMIGRQDEKHAKNPNYIYLIGSDKLSSQLHSISENVNKTYSNLELDYTFNDEKDKNRFYYRSDHYNFAKKGIPVIFYFNGVHEDYHRITDDVEKINFEKMEKISRFVFFTTWELANRNERIVVDSHKK
jgi:Peptidase family M28